MSRFLSLAVLLPSLILSCGLVKHGGKHSAKSGTTHTGKNTTATTNSTNTTTTTSTTGNSTVITGTTIDVTTTNEAVNPYLFSGNTELMFFTHDGARDVFAQPYLGYIQQIHFRSLNWSGGTVSNNSLIVDTLHPERGDGYNFDPPCMMNTVPCMKFGVDFWTEFIKLCDTLNVPYMLDLNMRNGTIGMAKWEMKQGDCRWIQADMESNTGASSVAWPTPADYKNKNNLWYQALKKQGVEWGVSYAPVGNNQKDDNWNSVLNNSGVIKGDATRVYFWYDDRVVTLSDNAADNMSKLENVVNNLLPAYLDKMQATAKGKKLWIQQFGLEGKDKTVAFGAQLGALTYALSYREFIEYNHTHNQALDYVGYQNLKNIIDKYNHPITHQQVLTLIGQLFQGNPTYANVTANNKVYWCATTDGNHVNIMAVNTTAQSYSFDQLKINGAAKQATSIRQMTAKDGLLAKDATIDDAGSLTLKPYSITIIKANK